MIEKQNEEITGILGKAQPSKTQVNYYEIRINKNFALVCLGMFIAIALMYLGVLIFSGA